MARSIVITCLLLAAATASAAQDTAPASAPIANDVVGSVGGKPVTSVEFAIELAGRYRDHKLGANLIQDFRDRFLVELGAQEHGVTVAASEVEAEYRAIDERVKKETGGAQTLDQALTRRNTDPAEFRTHLRRLVVVRKIVRAERKLAADADVSDDEVRAWLKTRAAAAKVVTDPATLPAGVVLKVDERRLTLARFGTEILAALTLKDRVRELNRVLNERVLAATLASMKLAVTEADLDEAIARERKRYADHPQTRTVPYEAILKQLGTTVEGRKRDPNLRANTALRKIAQTLYTDEQLASYYAANQDRLGPAVRARHILARVKGPKNPFAAGASEEDARKRIEALRAEILAGGKFEKLARTKSDDRSRFRGGDIGFIYREGKIDPAFAEAAFKLEVGALSPLVRSQAGYHLIQVTEKRPAAPFAEVREKVLRARARDWFQEAIRSADIRNVYLEQLKASRKASAEAAKKRPTVAAPAEK